MQFGWTYFAWIIKWDWEHLRKVIINCQSQPISRNNSLSGAFQKTICLLTFKVTFSEEKCWTQHACQVTSMSVSRVYNPAIPWVNGSMLEAELHCRKKTSWGLSHHTPVPTVAITQTCLLYSQCRLYSPQNIRAFYVIYFCSGNSRGILYVELQAMMSRTKICS